MIFGKTASPAESCSELALGRLGRLFHQNLAGLLLHWGSSLPTGLGLTLGFALGLGLLRIALGLFGIGCRFRLWALQGTGNLISCPLLPLCQLSIYVLRGVLQERQVWLRSDGEGHHHGKTEPGPKGVFLSCSKPKSQCCGLASNKSSPGGQLSFSPWLCHVLR